MNESIDLLLINCSNLLSAPVYPYAFIQLSALARKQRLRLKRLDLLKLSEQQIALRIKDYINRFRPRMIGFTIRQLDSILVGDYLPEIQVMRSPTADDTPINFFPLESTRDVILKVRSITDAPIVVGGIGFSTSALEISRYLEVDFGVRGDPDGLFDNFEALLKKENLSSIPNLIYRSGGEYVENHQCFFEPFNGMEYTEEIVDDIKKFYGQEPLYGFEYTSAIPLPNTRASIPIEISRGCPFHCCYCMEPIIKGPDVRYRNLDAVVEDILFIASYGLRYFWLVCSELNMGSNEFALSVAEQILKTNEKLGDKPIMWRSYFLPRWFSTDDLRLLYRSGFIGGWNDFPCWEDDNLARNKVPFKAEHILKHLKDVMIIEKERQIEPDIFSIFLGNPYADAKSISTTLRLYDEHGIGEYYGDLGFFSVPAIRVYEFCLDRLPIDKDEITTITREGITEPNLIHPSFHFPPYLYKTLGGMKEINDFFLSLPNTVRSKRSLRYKDWSYFLSQYCSPEHLSKFILEKGERKHDADILNRDTINSEVAALVGNILKMPTTSSLRDVFAPPYNEKDIFNTVAFILLEILYSRHFVSFEEVLDFLELPADSQGNISLSTYRLMERLYAQYSSTEALLKTVKNHFKFDNGSIQMFLINYLIYLFDVRIKPDYKELLFGAK